MAAFTKVSLIAGAATVLSAEATSVTPVQKVVDMMNGMLAKGKDEKLNEQHQHASYVQFCDDTKTEKSRRIAEANEHIGKLNADIDKYTSDAAMLSKEIAEHDEDIAVWNGDLKAAQRVRNIEKGDYDTTHKDYSESIDALGRAISTLKGATKDQAQAAAFVQISSLRNLRNLGDDARRAIDEFLASQQVSSSMSALQQGSQQPAALGYEAKSHGIIEMLNKLLDKFNAERTVLENAERDSVQAYEVLKQDLEAEISTAEADRTEKTELKASKLQARADAEGELSDTTNTRDADQKYLDGVTATCAQKESDFQARQKLRAEEIVALEKAVEIISSDSVSGSADKHLPALLQTRKTALSQLRAAAGAETTEESRNRLNMYLQAQAKHLNSRVLSMVAARAASDPFGKVKQMIKDMITKLMDEANEEAGHKAWCDSELATNEQTRKEKTHAVEMLHAEVDSLNVAIAGLTDELSDLAAAIASLDSAMAEATDYRQKEKETNTKTISDATAAQEAVASALAILNEFYAKAGDQAMVTEKEGVIGMLDVISTDFARLESETTAAEEAAQKEYDGFMKDSNADKSAKETDIEHKTAKKQDKNQALVVTKEDLQGNQDELDAALKYFDELKPSCVNIDVSYDDRVARRQEEIDSLQSALKLLE